MKKTLTYDWRIALPFLLAGAAGALDKLLPLISSYHPASSVGVLAVALSLVLGDWLRAQILSAEANQAQPVTPAEPPRPPIVVRTVTGPPDVVQAGISETLMRSLIEEAVADHLAAHAQPPTPSDRPAVVSRPRTVK